MTAQVGVSRELFGRVPQGTSACFPTLQWRAPGGAEPGRRKYPAGSRRDSYRADQEPNDQSGSLSFPIDQSLHRALCGRHRSDTVFTRGLVHPPPC